MAANPKLVGLIQKLLELTREGKIDWDEGYGTDSYRFIKEYASVEVSYLVTAQPEMQYFARLLDDAGRCLGSLPMDNDGEAELSLLRDLYIAAERSAGRGDELIDRLISDFNRVS